ncbi:MAG TPA: UDP-N-acetylmuramoyl-L-alanine--D-glutamate ligase [Dehalococcoidia bacterium]|nr:UDP-N-acetylmuramoyl-L-alanine--D-glutamate ligase [Dehalococcoidia bacterium]
MIDIRDLAALDFAGKRVTVVGLGIEGVDLVRHLARQGAHVTVSDSRPADKLGDRMQDVAGLSVRLALGSSQTEEVASADAVFVSQSVPLDLPGLRAAREAGIPLISMTGLFLDVCPGPVVGITGSSGKTTTTALVAEMFRADERPVFVGGNIGIGLLDQLSLIRPYTWSVLEISHTQLQLVESSPHVAALLNITPNHLDRFSWEEYVRLKKNILRFQTGGDVAILNLDDAESRAAQPLVRGRLLWFTMMPEVPGDGVCVREGWAVLRWGKLEERLFSLADVRLRGIHNRANAVAAAAISAAAGVLPDAIACAIDAFRGVPHRLELIGEAKGIAYYNDSIATTPERTVAGLRSFDERVVLLLGGRDKHLPLEELAVEAAGRCRAVVLFGESAPKLQEALREGAPGTRVIRVDTLAQAVEAASAAARAGDVVLLSPACTSYDAYENFERRGEHFRTLVTPLVKEVLSSLP